MLYQQTAVLVGTGNTEWLALLSSAVIAKGMMSSHFIPIHTGGVVRLWGSPSLAQLTPPALPRHQIWLVNVSGMSASLPLSWQAQGAYLDSQVGRLSHSSTVLPKIYKQSQRGGACRAGLSTWELQPYRSTTFKHRQTWWWWK